MILRKNRRHIFKPNKEQDIYFSEEEVPNISKFKIHKEVDDIIQQKLKLNPKDNGTIKFIKSPN